MRYEKDGVLFDDPPLVDPARQAYIEPFHCMWGSGGCVPLEINGFFVIVRSEGILPKHVDSFAEQ